MASRHPASATQQQQQRRAGRRTGKRAAGPRRRKWGRGVPRRPAAPRRPARTPGEGPGEQPPQVCPPWAQQADVGSWLRSVRTTALQLVTPPGLILPPTLFSSDTVSPGGPAGSLRQRSYQPGGLFQPLAQLQEPHSQSTRVWGWGFYGGLGGWVWTPGLLQRQGPGQARAHSR